MLELAFYIGLYTTHIGGDDFNENNQIIAVEYRDVVVGRMINSFNNESYYLAYNYRFNDWSGVLLGGVSGYDYDCIIGACNRSNMKSNDIVPIAAPYIQWQGVHALLQLNAVSVVYRF